MRLKPQQRAIFSSTVAQPSGCTVCLQPVRRGFVLPCGHSFHCGCMRGWTDRGHRSCPNCRASFVIAPNPKLAESADSDDDDSSERLQILVDIAMRTVFSSLDEL